MSSDICTCIKHLSFAVYNSGVSGNAKKYFFKNKKYTYTKSFHLDSDLLIYEVFISPDLSLPMMEKRFLQHFNTIQEIRDKLITSILDQIN